MRKFFRITFAVLMAISLVICITFLAGGILSYRDEGLSYFGVFRDDIVQFHCQYGICRFETDGHIIRTLNSYLGGSSFEFMGFYFSSECDIPIHRDERGTLILQRRGGFPLFRFALPFGLFPCVYFFVLRRLKRRGSRLAGHCRVCDYDLRATPDRCPECGTITPVGSVHPKVE